MKVIEKVKILVDLKNNPEKAKDIPTELLNDEFFIRRIHEVNSNALQYLRPCYGVEQYILKLAKEKASRSEFLSSQIYSIIPKGSRIDKKFMRDFEKIVNLAYESARRQQN